MSHWNEMGSLVLMICFLFNATYITKTEEIVDNDICMNTTFNIKYLISIIILIYIPIVVAAQTNSLIN